MTAIVINSSEGGVTPTPVRLLSSREIAEMALQKIGAYTTNDSGADPNELERALEWMETEIAHLSGVHRLHWLIPTTIQFDLEDDIAEYVLADVLASAAPSLLVAYPISAYVGTVTDPDDADEEVSFTEIPIVRRSQYEDHDNKATAGVPEEIYIDRLNDNKSLFVYPVQDPSVNARLRLVFQTYPQSVKGQGAEDTAGDVPHGFDRTWQKWLIYMTAAAIGDGPVRRLDANTLKGIQVIAGQALIELNGAQNREKITKELRRTRRYGG